MGKIKKSILEKLNLLWEQRYPELELNEKEDSWDQFSRKVFEKKQPKLIKLNYIYYAAAIILLLFVADQTVFKNEISYSIVENIDKSIKQVTLPDNSLIALQPGGKLYYATNFLNNRALKLEGEAFFQVTKDKKHPFTVQCEQTETTVLGTSFNIKSFSNSDKVEIALYEGSVSMSVEGRGNNWILSPGEMFVYNNKGNTIESFNNFFNPLSSYVDLENVSLLKVVEYVDKIYGYQIILDHQILIDNITLRISKGESLENIINVISTIYKLKPEINEELKQIKLTK